MFETGLICLCALLLWVYAHYRLSVAVSDDEIERAESGVRYSSYGLVATLILLILQLGVNL